MQRSGGLREPSSFGKEQVLLHRRSDSSQSQSRNTMGLTFNAGDITPSAIYSGYSFAFSKAILHLFLIKKKIRLFYFVCVSRTQAREEAGLALRIPTLFSAVRQFGEDSGGRVAQLFSDT